jgi:hypothetical protein
VAEGGNLPAALEELKAILISPIKASHCEDKERDETEIGGNTADSHVESNGSDSNTAVPDDDIPVKFTKVMGKGRIWKSVQASGFLFLQTCFSLAQIFFPPTFRICPSHHCWLW